MKICIFDSWNKKFSGAIADHWRSLGHQVLFDPPWEAMMEADLTFFYQADNVLVEASTKKIPHKGKVFGQAVDIEVWAGQAEAVDWSYTDGCLFMAQHIQDKVLHALGNTKFSLIKPGIDTVKWTLRPTPEPSPVKRIAYVVGDHRIWDVKRLDIAFQLLRDLLNSGGLYQLHIRGTYSSHEQYNAYCRYLEKDLKLEGFVFWYEEKIEDMNKWLDDKDFFLLPSTKEAFSYATAEAMCKGIKPIINDWQGSKETWGEFVSETYGEMLFRILREPSEPNKYRQYIIDNYNQDRYFLELDKFLEIL